MPTHEAQVRPLIGLEPDQIKKAWLEAIEEGKDHPIIAKLVKLKASLYKKKEILGAKHSKKAAPKRDAHLGVRDANEVVKTIDQLEHAIRTGGLSDTILCMIAKLRSFVQRIV
jgi:hypothetical protein